ncbi:LPXTG cell wall anchor domain-containing protein [Streptomyces sp. NBC_01294]|uniref:LPXTG cell wall anchor domain-containing protein n=1 Tax=Streptomyces sp. NBC_01294 TaxID=2903815 RepID=UPI002DD81106|nr:LPXTG cell wall anchor domain-containing protein [Streptomyces sp. NBC_01294]WRZ58913.1 LPXTG cell wall anchor domain-containing protein [Streptomyces sp. NBC_01294]
MHRLRWATTALPVAASLVLAAGAPAFATDSYTVPVHQALPLTATSQGVENQAKCASIPSSQDGWHFVLPGNSTTFKKLTVTFEPGGQQVVTVFGPPSDKHAYVASVPGAKLTAASAEVVGGSVEWFNLSHTCPSTATASPSPSQSTSASPSASTSASASASTSASASASTSASASASTSASASSSTSPSGSTQPSGSASSPAPTGSTAATGGSTGGGDLAKTGSDAPIGLLATMAAALIAAGAVLVVRRRKAGAEG